MPGSLISQPNNRARSKSLGCGRRSKTDPTTGTDRTTWATGSRVGIGSGTRRNCPKGNRKALNKEAVGIKTGPFRLNLSKSGASQYCITASSLSLGRYLRSQLHFIPTVAFLLSPSLQPIPFIQPRSTWSACVHLGLFLVAQAEGQHNCLTSLIKHMGTPSRFSPSNSAAITSGVICHEPFRG